MKKCRIISKTLFTTIIMLICILTPCMASSDAQVKSGGFGKFLLILIGFGLAAFIIYMSYRTDKREEMHLKKVNMVQEKKTKINKKQIENMISTFMKNSTKEIKDRIMSIKDGIGKDIDDVDESEDDDEDDIILDDVKQEEINIKDEENNIDINDAEDIDISNNTDDMDMDAMLLEAIGVEDLENFENEEKVDDSSEVETVKEPEVIEEPEEEEVSFEDIIGKKSKDISDDEIISIDFEEVQREGLETSSKEVVAGIVKGYDYDEEDFNEPALDTDENSEVDELLDIILPKRYTRKKTKVESKKLIKRYTRKKENKKTKKPKVKKYYSTGLILSRKNRVINETEEVFEDNAGIEIDEPVNTNEYVDYKEILDIIDPKAKSSKKNVEVVTIDRSAIEPFMPKRETTKRGRGRPKKEVTEDKPKRGRGRPRKEVTEDKPKRGRGRPRKTENS